MKISLIFLLIVCSKFQVGWSIMQNYLRILSCIKTIGTITIMSLLELEIKLKLYFKHSSISGRAVDIAHYPVKLYCRVRTQKMFLILLDCSSPLLYLYPKKQFTILNRPYIFYSLSINFADL